MIKAIAFDFGGTLFSTRRMGEFTSAMTDAFQIQVRKHWNCSLDESASVFRGYSDSWKSRRSRGASLPEKETSSKDLLQVALARLGYDLREAAILDVLNAFHAEEATQFDPLAGVTEVIPKLAADGYRLWIVSNNPWSESIRASLRRFQLEQYFDGLVVSCDVGYRKPHQQIFDAFLAKAELSAPEVLFIGDSHPHDIETPKRLGMKTCLVDFERMNKNQQSEHATMADAFLTQIDQLPMVISKF